MDGSLSRGAGEGQGGGVAPPRQIAAVLTDIEGTTTAIAFVHRVLFPYADRRLDAFLETHARDPAVARALAEAAADPDAAGDVKAALHRWIAEDRKFGPLKTLQGLIWESGFRAGELRAHLYPDVAPCLRAWAAGGMRLAVYSSGSVGAQKLLFGHTDEGDLTGLFSGFFDTAVGAKRESASYARIAAALDLPGAAILFLSDVEAELDAAAAAGLGTCQLVRAEDGTRPGERHRVAADFFAVAELFALPAVAPSPPS
jgi:enolase-phosphatase E1